MDSRVEVEPLANVSPGAWLPGHLTSLDGVVRSVIPAAYEAHVLVTHRADSEGGSPIGCLDHVSLAALRDLLLPETTTPDLCWLALWEGHPGLPKRWVRLPKLHLPHRAYLLFSVPGRHIVEQAVETAALQFEEEPQGVGYFRQPDEAELLRLAEHSRAVGRVRSPNLWWPEDRAWVVGTDIDGDDSLVACSHAAAEAILASHDLDAETVAADDPLTERS